MFALHCISCTSFTHFRALGYETELIGPADIEKLIPWVRVDDLEGGMLIPGDGSTSPKDTVMALAAGATAKGMLTIICMAGMK